MKKLLLLCLLAMTLANCLAAQEVTSTVVGTITDATGAVVPNAKITLTDPAKGASREGVTGTAGDYNIPFVSPGTYDMKVEAKGFATVEQKGISLFLGKTVTVNQTLKPGGANEVVEVTSAPPMIETQVSNVVGSVSPSEVSNLPILDRNFSGLETLIPGVRQAEGFDPTKTRVGNISVNGGDGRQVDTAVDGGDNKDLVVGGLVQNFTMEGIQEFNVQTNRYTAEAGHSVAAVVNVVTKSGTNSLHGSAYSLFQNSGLNAQDYFTKQSCLANGITEGNCPKPLLHRYDYGGSLGGPFIKDKLFFFGAFEQKREPGTLTVNPSTIPSLSAFAAETAGLPGGPYAAPVPFLPFPYVDSLLTAKGDWNISSKQNAFVRFGWQKWTTTNDQLINPFTTDGSQGNNDQNIFYDIAIQHNYTISPSKVNSFNFHIQDFANIIPASPTRTFTYPLAGGGNIVNPYIFFSDGNSVGQNPNVPQQTLIRKYQFSDTFSLTKGTHSIKFGGNEIYFAKTGGYFFSQLGYTLQFWDAPPFIQQNPTIYPQGVSTPGAVEDILLNGGSGSTAQPPWSSLGLFVQDDWKVSPRLTLNLGLRWDANIDFLQPQLSNSLTNSNKAIYDLRTQVINNPAFAGLANTEGGKAILGIAGNASDLRRTTSDWKEFQPRVGFAWDITGNGTQVLRGGYGIARDQIFQNITLWSIQQSQPTIYQGIFEATGSTGPGGANCTNVGTGPVNPCTFRFGVDPLPTPPPPTTDLAFGATPRITNPRITDPWSQQFGLGYAWQITPDYAFSADYVHIIGTHEERVLNMNPTIKRICDPNYPTALSTMDPTYGTVCPNGAGTRLMDQVFAATGFGVGHYNKIYDYSTNNRSFYDGINLQLRKRFSNRIQFQVSDVISWSRSWGGFPVASYGGSGLAITPQQQFQPSEFGDTNFDERNRLTFSGVFNLPKGFSLNPIFTAASARPYSIIAGQFPIDGTPVGDIDGDGRIAIDRVCQGSTLNNIIATPGCTMIKPNTLRGKPYVNMNVRVDKQFKFGERANLLLYWELYDLFNRANFCNSYEENSQASNFNKPQSYCNGPSNSAYAGISGFQAAAVPAFSSQFGFRVNF